MHQSYEEILKRQPDFRVAYRFYTPEEGGRSRLPLQGIRFDFWYESELHPEKQHFMIWPEFEDENQVLIKEGFVFETGTARMWIVSPDWRDYHREKIQMGTVGYFIEGIRNVTVCEVTEIISLLHK
jgi:translation elongation factor EF-4